MKNSIKSKSIGLCYWHYPIFRFHGARLSPQLHILVMLLLVISCKKPTATTPQVGSGRTNELMLNERQIRLANITTQKISVEKMGQTIVANARLVANQASAEVISSRAAGRIEKLFIKETGRIVKKGEPLYELYSEPLQVLQREFLLANAQYELLGKTEPRYESFKKAAERKLFLYGLSKSEVEKLAKSKVVQDHTTFLAPVSGVVTTIDVNEGQSVIEGTMLYRIEDLSKLWVEADLYRDESTLINEGEKVIVKIIGHEVTPLETTIAFISPEYSANTQVTRIRSGIDNADLAFKPGMQAQVLFTQAGKKTLAIPAGAVIRDEKGTHVYIQTKVNTFESRMVQTGLENFDQVEIINGLKENDVVAVTGVYLLDSELILKRGSNPMAGHH